MFAWADGGAETPPTSRVSTGRPDAGAWRRRSPHRARLARRATARSVPWWRRRRRRSGTGSARHRHPALPGRRTLRLPTPSQPGRSDSACDQDQVLRTPREQRPAGRPYAPCWSRRRARCRPGPPPGVRAGDLATAASQRPVAGSRQGRRLRGRQWSQPAASSICCSSVQGIPSFGYGSSRHQSSIRRPKWHEFGMTG